MNCLLSRMIYSKVNKCGLEQDKNTYLRLGSHEPPGKAGTTLTYQSIRNPITPIPPTIYVLRTKDLMLLPPLILPCPKPMPFSPTLARPILFHENMSLMYPDCTLMDLLLCSSLLCQQEEPSFPSNMTTLQNSISLSLCPFACPLCLHST